MVSDTVSIDDIRVSSADILLDTIFSLCSVRDKSDWDAAAGSFTCEGFSSNF